MTEQASKSKRAPSGKAAVGRLFLLDLSGGRVLSLNPDGSDRKIIVTECRNPDGIVVDVGSVLILLGYNKETGD
jgi:hypothetical protein